MRDVNWTRGESKRLILTCAIVWMLLGGMLAPVAIGAPDTTTANTTTGTVASGGSTNTTGGPDSTNNSSTTTGSEASSEVTSAVAAGSGEKTVIVRFSDPQQLPASAADAEPVDKMQIKATSSQHRFERFAAGNPHVEIKDSFWIANAKLVHVDTAEVPLRRLAGIKNVDKIHRNHRVTGLDTTPVLAGDAGGIQQVSTASSDYTWGLEEIRAPKTWQQFDHRGGNVSVAVLDTGVDDSHPDIEVAKWKDFEDSAFDDGDGDSPSPTPKDYGYHGTHVSGTVVGGNASGTHIGVAPNATLYAGAVLTEDGGAGYTSNIYAGMEWAVTNDADVLSMSLGGSEITNSSIEPIRNARQAGTIPVVSIGNSGEGTHGSPGDVYESIAVGASNQNDAIAYFSGGDTVYKNEWNDPPTDWPSSYIVPDLSAPGTDVYSADSGGGYRTLQGTSMATPHVSGAIVLMLSNGHGDLRPSEAQSILEHTAVDLGEDANRQGAGEIDVYDATLNHSWNTLQPTLSPLHVFASQQVELTVAANHPINKYYWTFPNGSTVTTTDATVNHSFETTKYSATVDIVLHDVRGKNQTVTKTIDVNRFVSGIASVTTTDPTTPGTTATGNYTATLNEPVQANVTLDLTGNNLTASDIADVTVSNGSAATTVNGSTLVNGTAVVTTSSHGTLDIGVRFNGHINASDTFTASINSSDTNISADDSLSENFFVDTRGADSITVNSIGVDKQFVGVVKDDGSLGIIADVENEEGTPVTGTATVGLNDSTGTSYDIESVDVNSGTIDTTVDPTKVSEAVSVGSSATIELDGVATSATVTPLHEVQKFAADTVTASSVPQAGQIYWNNSDWSAVQWDESDQRYSPAGFDASGSFTSAQNLHRGLFVLTSSDVRIGYEYEPTTGSADGSTFTLQPGWNLVSSNYNISSGTVDLQTDLGTDYDTVAFTGGSGLDNSTTINEYDAYWIYTDSNHDRTVVAPGYDAAARVR